MALCALLSACGPLEVSTAIFAVGDLPPEVQSISIFVTEQDSSLVASATITAPRSSIALGVPAEVALQMTAVARSGNPAHASLGGRMPIYVARSLRTVPLGNEAFVVDLQARPGGGLTVLLDGLQEDGDLGLQLEGTQPSRALEINASLRGTRFVRVLQTGTWSLTSQDRRWGIEGGAGLWVEPGVHTVARPQVVESQPVLPQGGPYFLEVEVRLGGDIVQDLIPTSSIAPSELEVSVIAVDAVGTEVALEGAVELRAAGVPRDIVVGAEQSARGVPARFSGLAVSGLGRLYLEVRIQPAVGPALIASWHANVGLPGGSPVRLRLQVEDESRLMVGTRLRAELLDGAGRYAAAMPWRLDCSDSDPWAYFEDGAIVQIPGPVARLRLARPSGPLGLKVGLKAVVTSTVFEGTLTSSLSLPLGPLVEL